MIFDVARPATSGGLDVLVVADAAPADVEVDSGVANNCLGNRV